MKKNKFKIIISILALLILVVPALAFAAPAADIGKEIKNNLDSTGLTSLGGKNPLAKVVGDIVSYVLGFLGLFFILIIIYAGYMWGSAQGDDTKVKKAKAMIIQATIGVVIILAAYAITNTIIDTIGGATGAVGSGTTSDEPTLPSLDVNP